MTRRNFIKTSAGLFVPLSACGQMVGPSRIAKFNPNGVQASLSAYWPMEEASGNVLDQWGHADLIRSGSPAQAAGALNFSQQFGGVSDYLYCDYTPNGDMQFIHDFSGALSFWCYLTANGVAFSIGDSTQIQSYFTVSVRTDRILTESRGESNRALWYNSSEAKNWFTTISTGAWHHIWWDSTGFVQRVFLDNVLLTTGNPNNGWWFGDAGFYSPKIVFGARYIGSLNQYFSGRVDEVRIFSGYVPTTAERTAIYNGNVPQPAPNWFKPSAGPIDLFIGAGQSNCSSRVTTGYVPDRVSDDKVLYWYQTDQSGLTRINSNGFERIKAVHDNAEWGWEVSASRMLRGNNYRPAFLKVSKGTQSLAGTWNSRTPGAMWTEWKTAVSDAVSALRARGYTIRLRGMFWSQGESDANSTDAPNYQTNFTNLVADVRSYLSGTIGLDTTNFRFITALTQNLGADYVTVRAAQSAVMALNPLDGTIETNSYSTLDGVHYDGAGQTAMGNSFAAFF